MFNDVGKTIKGLASVLTWLGIIASFIAFLILLSTDEDLIGVAVIVFIVGSLVSWLSSLTLYGFGELVDNSAKMVKLLQKNDSTSLSDKSNSLSDKYKIKPASFNLTSASNGTCEMCLNSNVPVIAAKMEDTLGTRYRTVCGDCFVKHNCTEIKKK